MPEDVIAKAFDPFFTTKGAKGTGLGLSMVHGFVRQSGGHTRIYSEVGRGTTIRLYLPRAKEAVGMADEEKTTHKALTGTETILVVEDNQGLRDLALRALAELGYRTIRAGDGTEALDIVKGGVPFDLLFTDVVMPGGVDGRQLAESARLLRPGLKVLFTSGFTAAAASAAMTDEFGSNLLTKPYRKEELARYIRIALDNRD
jgi:CheY-like chemotaxis protein